MFCTEHSSCRQTTVAATTYLALSLPLGLGKTWALLHCSELLVRFDSVALVSFLRRSQYQTIKKI